MNAAKLKVKMLKYTNKELKLLLREANTLKELLEDVQHICELLETATKSEDATILAEHYEDEDEARAEERKVERIEKKLDIWISRIIVLIENEEVLPPSERIKLEKLKEDIEICRNSLRRILAWDGELHDLVKRDDFPEVKNKIKEALGTNEKIGIVSLIALLKELREYQDKNKSWRAGVYSVRPQLPAGIISKIRKLKKLVIRTCEESFLATEEPHITMNHNRFYNVGYVDKILANICKSTKSISATTNGIITWPHKYGRSALFYGVVESNPALTHLQREMSEKFAHLREGGDVREAVQDKVELTETEIADSERYGYLMVGKNWIPHISVAVLNPDCIKKIGEQLLSTEFNETFVINKIDLCFADPQKGKWTVYKSYSLQ